MLGEKRSPSCSEKVCRQCDVTLLPEFRCGKERTKGVTNISHSELQLSACRCY